MDRHFTNRHHQPDELIVGNLYFPYTVNDLLVGDELILVVVIEERYQQMLFFPADHAGYEIYLPHGVYSFLVLLVDIGLDDLLEADILAIGLPSALDLSGIDDINVESYDDIWGLLIDEPLQVGYGGPFYLDFVLLDTLEHPEFPSTLWELFSD